MSFLRPDNKPDQTDDNAAQATVDPFATPPPQPTDDGAAPQNDDGQTPPAPSNPADLNQPDASPQTDAVPVQAGDNNQQAGDSQDNSDVTVTTSEGSTLHTFNDPTLQNTILQNNTAPEQADETPQNPEGNMASGLAPDANDTNDSVNDALSFQDQDGSALTPAGDNPTEPEENSEQAPETNDNDTEGLPDGVATDDNFSAPVTPDETPTLAPTEPNSELDGIKKQALEQLRPLLEKVDLPPGEKFDKYLMMLRATDDPTLIEPAFKAAQGITEEKDKAEALVDIINEINYVSGDEQADEKPTE